MDAEAGLINLFKLAPEAGTAGDQYHEILDRAAGNDRHDALIQVGADFVLGLKPQSEHERISILRPGFRN